MSDYVFPVYQCGGVGNDQLVAIYRTADEAKKYVDDRIALGAVGLLILPEPTSVFRAQIWRRRQIEHFEHGVEDLSQQWGVTIRAKVDEEGAPYIDYDVTDWEWS